MAVAVFVAVSLVFSLKTRCGRFCFFGRGRPPGAHWRRPPHETRALHTPMRTVPALRLPAVHEIGREAAQSH